MKNIKKPTLKDILNMHDALRTILNSIKNEVEITANSLSPDQILLTEKLREESIKYTDIFNKVTEAMKAKVTEDFNNYFKKDKKENEKIVIKD